MATEEVLVPDIGNFKDVAVIEVLVKPGDRVEVDTPLLTLETEKATMDVPSPIAGVIEKLLVANGTLVSTGSLVALINAYAVVAAAPAWPRVPVVDFAAFGPVEIKPLTRIQKISGSRLHASWVNLPHVTQYDLADITELEETRKALKARAETEGVKLTPLAFMLRACALTLAQFPRFNASLDAAGENVVLKKYCHLGFAADTPNGLMVPVIRDADKKDVFALARALAELSEKARKGRLGAAEMQGGCFTISSLGGIGGTAFTPIINAPEVAILGVSKSSMQPVYQGGAFVPRLMLPLSLSYDHRVIDGAEGARFVTALSQALADVKRLLEPVA
jgi:pyruvate dehydrogenase E2 component (dihydrolipoamide acetyltransferase)